MGVWPSKIAVAVVLLLLGCELPGVGESGPGSPPSEQVFRNLPPDLVEGSRPTLVWVLRPGDWPTCQEILPQLRDLQRLRPGGFETVVAYWGHPRNAGVIRSILVRERVDARVVAIRERQSRRRFGAATPQGWHLFAQGSVRASGTVSGDDHTFTQEVLQVVDALVPFRP